MVLELYGDIIQVGTSTHRSPSGEKNLRPTQLPVYLNSFCMYYATRTTPLTVYHSKKIIGLQMK